jgi:hypothetical protein
VSAIRWDRTPDRTTWQASTPGMVVTKLSSGMWVGVVGDARSPEFSTRLLAQRWAERRAGGAR